MARLPALRIDLAALKGRLASIDLDRLRPSPRRIERARLYADAVLKLVRDQVRAEWSGSAPHRWLLAKPAPEGLAAAPSERRPARARRGKAIAAGRFVFAGLVLEAGPGGDPWNRPAPSRARRATCCGRAATTLAGPNAPPRRPPPAPSWPARRATS